MNPLLNGYMINSNRKAIKTTAVPNQHDDQEHTFSWFHLDLKRKSAKSWLENNSDLPELIISNLLISESRPSILTFDEGILLTLRGMNFNESSQPEDMIALNVWIDDSKVITTRSSRILAIDDILKQIEAGNGPNEPSEFVYMLINSLNKRIKEVIENIDDEADELEQLILENSFPGIRSKLIALRKKILTIRRYLLPQREVLARLYSDNYRWINEKNRLLLRDTSEKLNRYLEDLDMIRDHIALTQEELSSSINEQMNQTLYILGIVSALFLPLGFLTGILGINVGGIPGVDNSNSFTIVCIISAIFLISGYIFFRMKKKI